MPLIRPRKENPNRPAELRRKLRGEERELLARGTRLQSQSMNPEDEAPSQTAAASTAMAPVPDKSIQRFRDGLTVEQKVKYDPGKGKPCVEARISLTTAVRGKRKKDELSESAYLLRVAVLDASPSLRVEGICFGPWQLRGLNLEAGTVYLSEPVWTAFKPWSGPVKGRILLEDAARHRILDLPLATEAVIPGAELSGS